MSISIVLTVYNKENLIRNVLLGILNNISDKTTEFIVVLDGCTDNSEKILLETLNSLDLSQLKVQILKTDDVYETRANNVGLKASSGDYCIIFQDDMVVREKNFDKRLIQPLLQYDDLFAVTARNAHNLFLKDNIGMIDWCDIVGGPVGDRFDHSYRIPSDFDRDTMHLKLVINRGPVAFDMSKLKRLNYFDETLPGIICCDDHDLCLRARINFGWKCGAYWIWYESRSEWGTSRTCSSDKSKFFIQQEELNRKELYNRYSTIIPSLVLNETRKINNN